MPFTNNQYIFAVLILFFKAGFSSAQGIDQERQSIAEQLVNNAGGCMYALTLGVESGYVSEHDANAQRVSQQIENISGGFFGGDLNEMISHPVFLSGWNGMMEIMADADLLDSYPNVLINCSIGHDFLLRKILE